MSYLLFDARRINFDVDGNGSEGSLIDHLDYLAKYEGTPDCYHIVTGSLADAVSDAQKAVTHVCIVDSSTYKVVGRTG